MVVRLLRIAVSALCLAVLAASGIAEAATVKNVRLWRATDHTRVVLDLDAPVGHSLTLAPNPLRLIVVLPNSRLKNSVSHLPLAGTPIDIIRSSDINQRDLRLVFELKKNVAPKSFTLKKHGDNDDRLVIDLYDTNEPAPVSKPLMTAAKPAVAGANEPVDFEANTAGKNAAKPAANASGRPILIAVDAGHGGEDTGALGPNNMREKDVTLAIARELARVINEQPGYTAKLTRTGDYFVVLQKRRDLARDMKADLFISIHADSFTDSSAYGASVFALSRKGATSEMARFLAQRENDSDLVGRVGGVSLEDKDAVLAGVLVDLSMTATVNASLQLGHHVLSSISGIAPLHAKHVEQAGFVVLKSPDVPSILVETGFISNKNESKKLASSNYREQMAKAVFKGVRQYFADHPVAGSQLAVSDEAPERSKRTR